LRKYNDPNWEESVSCYDDQGNPYSWFKHSDTMPTTLGYDLKWKYCKQLTEVKTRETTPITYIYTYNDSGFRTKKTANGTTNQYYLEGSRIIAEDRTTSGVTIRLFYYYDANGICGFNYNNADYYYIKNLQGDITGILDSAGTTVASYTYDAWGKILSTTGTMAEINPFRYRGYYYDSETGWYYLNSRYYDPIVGRFLNSDESNYLDPESINGLNLYAYCLNNPVNYYDDNGNWPHRIDDKGKPSEHIHLKIGNKNYAWYKNSKETRDPWKNKGYEDLSKTQKKTLRKGGIPLDYLNKISYVTLPRWQEGFSIVNLSPWQEGFSIVNLHSNQEGFSILEMPRWQEGFNTIEHSIGDGIITFGNTISNWWTGMSTDQQVGIVIVAGVVVLCIVLAPFSGGLSLLGLAGA
jgi:RHS repeat-associated protein